MNDPYTPTLRHGRPPASRTRTITKVLSSSGPERVTEESLRVRVLNVSGFKGNNTANTNPVYVGLDATLQPYYVPSTGTTVVKGAHGSELIDTADLWLRGTSGDGVVVTFQEDFR